MSRYDDWPPKTKPRRVEGGIKAQTKRGAFGQRWWAKRWIAVLESFQLGARLTRGRAYARAGQVVDIALETGGVRASVQGSRAKPYAVTIRMRELTRGEWAAVGSAIAADTRLAAMLLAGDMPEDIESAFAAAGTTLFPKTEKELKTACSCPDWSNPCKHVAAVFYLIGEEFDRDPFLLFVVRGLPRAGVRELLAPSQPAPNLGTKSITKPAAKRGGPPPGSKRAGAPPAEKRRGPPARAQRANGTKGVAHSAQPDSPQPDLPLPDLPLPDSPLPDSPLPNPPAQQAKTGYPVVAPAVDAVLLRKAGRFPFWRADDTLEDALTPMYARGTEAALAWLAEHPES